MEWRGRRQSDNIEDRRGQSSRGGFGRNPFGRSGIQIPMGGRRGGGLSFGTIIFLVVIYFVLKAMGIDMLQVLGEGNIGGQAPDTSNRSGSGRQGNRATTPPPLSAPFWRKRKPPGMRSSRHPASNIASRRWSCSAGPQLPPAVRHRLPPVPSIVPPTARSIWTPSSSINSSGSSMPPAISPRPM